MSALCNPLGKFVEHNIIAPDLYAKRLLNISNSFLICLKNRNQKGVKTNYHSARDNSTNGLSFFYQCYYFYYPIKFIKRKGHFIEFQKCFLASEARNKKISIFKKKCNTCVSYN